jgi:DNA-binding CsgD family transcriptional regulator
LSVQESEIFKLLGQGEGGAKEIAEKLTNRDKRNGSKNKGKKGISESTVNVYLPRIWEKAGKDSKMYSIHKLRRLAILCLEAGWDTTLKINQEMLGKQ